MRLIRAELRKLGRPLTWDVAGAAAVFCVLLAVGGAHNASLEGSTPVGHLPSCAELGVPAGPQCTRAKAEERARVARASAQPAHVAAQLNPLAAGAEAAGLMASLPGALALALLAGAHVGGEWSGKTMKNLLTQQGRRWQVLAAKLASLWLAGVGLIAVCWVALAVAGPVLVRADHLPAAHESAAHALSLAGSQVARALLVLAVFAAIGVLAAVLTRGIIGATAATAGAIIAMLIAASLPGTGRWTPATAGGPVRVLVADDQVLVRAGLATLLDSQPDLEVVGQAGDGREATWLARELRPDVVLMDIRMPVLDGLAATRQIVAQGNGEAGGTAVKVIVLTTYDLDEYVYEALRAGASGFLLKHAPPEELLLGVRAAADGGALLSPAVTSRLLAEFAARRPAPAREPAELARLTPREREVLDLVIRGRSNDEIAHDLVVSHSTVKTHVTHVLDKLGLRDRVHAVVYGYEHGLIEPGQAV